MTTREHLNQIRKRATMLAIPGWLLAAMGGFISNGKGSWSILLFIGFALFAGGILLGLFYRPVPELCAKTWASV